MSDQLATAFDAVLAQAAQAPADTGATTKFRTRFENASFTTIAILADVSSSMAERAGAQSKSEILKCAIADSMGENRNEVLVAFSSTPRICKGAEWLPDPSGSTALHLALEYLFDFKPRATLVVSDGRPDDEQKALDAAERLTGRIDVIYVGPDDDTQAIAFMNKLARVGCGRVIVEDVVKNAARPRLTGAMREVLALPRGGVA
jgi:hypothetical protein